MALTSAAFLPLALAFVLAFNLARGALARRLIFSASNVLFLWLVMPGPFAVAGFLLFLLCVWLATRVVDRWRSAAALAATLFLLIGLFGWLKRYEMLAFLPFSSSLPTIVGLSYVLIRALQLLIDQREDTAARPDFLPLFNFLTAWQSLIAGPIQRFQDFEAQQGDFASFRLDAPTVDYALRRAARGYILLAVLSNYAQLVWLNLADWATHGYAPFALAGAQLSFLVYLFLNFAGYTDVVIGLGCLTGLRLPENFDRPWMSTSFLDFWGRWHMSMTAWFKTYVFTPVSAYLMRRGRLSRAVDLEGVIAFFVTFFLVGLWHGTTAAFVICGVLLGLGASVNQLYRDRMRKALGRARFARLSSGRLYTVASAVVALTYVCVSASALWMSLPQMTSIVARLGVGGNLIALGALLLMLSVVVPVVRLLSSLPSFGRWPVPAPLITAAYVGAAFFLAEFYGFLSPTQGGGIFYGKF